MDNKTELTAESNSETSLTEIRGLTLCLLGLDTLKGGPAEFPDYLNLSITEDWMRELFGQKQIVSQELTPGIPTLGIEPTKIEGEGEIAKTIYYNVKTDSLDATDTVRGGLTSVRSSFTDAYGEGKMPLIEMHTHPEASLPSNVDYQFMLLGNPEAKIRAVEAIAVLCPEFQIFALATTKTPILDSEGLHQLLTQWDEPNRQYEIEGGKYLKTLENRWQRVAKFMTESYKREQEKIVESFKKEMERIAQGLDSEDEEESSINDFSQAMERVNRIFPKVSSKHSNYLKKTFTKIQLQFARDMGIKLYMSTDFKNFTAVPDNFAF